MAGADYGLTRLKERNMKITLFAGNNERSFDSVSDCLAQAEKLLQQGVAIRLIPSPELIELKGFRLDGRRFLAIDEIITKKNRMGCLMSSYRLSKDERQAFIIEQGIFVPCQPSVHGTSLSNGFKLSEAIKIQVQHIYHEGE
jgi:hypothetical protein